MRLTNIQMHGDTIPIGDANIQCTTSETLHEARGFHRGVHEVHE